jgi:hypothetical protein
VRAAAAGIYTDLIMVKSARAFLIASFLFSQAASFSHSRIPQRGGAFIRTLSKKSKMSSSASERANIVILPGNGELMFKLQDCESDS